MDRCLKARIHIDRNIITITTRYYQANQSQWPKMLTTLVLLLATAITCYGFALSASNSVQSSDSLFPEGASAQDEPELLLATAAARPSGGRQQAELAEPALAGVTLGRPPSSIRNVTAQNGQSVLLHCLVEPSSELSVSWFRGAGELQLLTYESNTIIQDERFVVRRGLVKDDDWALQIKNLDKSTDSGLYQCQTNSDPPQSQYYQLNVLEPQVHILGAPDMAVKLGSTINLTCVISQSPDQLQFIFWYRNDRMINYDMGDRGKIVISKWPQKQDTITSNLQIFNSKLSDSANYTCMPSGARPISIYVHVLEALDKRLIMFQNDHDPTAASSQQTNSATSVHVVRLPRGPAYAFFLAFIIFSSWLELVLQIQTAISLLLLALVGFLLGRLTDPPASVRQPAHDKLDALSSLACSPQHSSLKTSSSTENQLDQRESVSLVDTHIRRANSALNLLKSLSGSGSDDDDCQDRSSTSALRSASCCDQQSDRVPPSLAPLGAKLAFSALTRPDNKPLASPSSSSHSSGSTGYNSDSIQTTRATPPEPEEQPMIELRQPTALQIIMDELTAENRPDTPSKPPRSSEPVYSTPVEKRHHIGAGST